jgi:hypothetical protein
VEVIHNDATIADARPAGKTPWRPGAGFFQFDDGR